MKEYRFIVRKVQEATVSHVCTGQETVEEMMKLIEQLPEDEIEFSEPEYHLVAISKEDFKVSKLLWLLK
jgi:hypothetical protein